MVPHSRDTVHGRRVSDTVHKLYLFMQEPFKSPELFYRLTRINMAIP